MRLNQHTLTLYEYGRKEIFLNHNIVKFKILWYVLYKYIYVMMDCYDHFDVIRFTFEETANESN